MLALMVLGQIASDKGLNYTTLNLLFVTQSRVLNIWNLNLLSHCFGFSVMVPRNLLDATYSGNVMGGISGNGLSMSTCIACERRT